MDLLSGTSDADPIAVVPVHVGRQPLFDRRRDVVGHELLFRAAAHRTDAGPDAGDAATTTVILNTFTAFGLSELVSHRPAFVNVTRPFMVGDLPVPFSPADAVLEVVESIPADDEVLAGARRLVAQGYELALDDFLWSQTDRHALLPFASYVKVDITQLPADELAPTVARLHERGVRVVAERIEDADDLHRCEVAGADLFQGYHLLRPVTLSTAALEPRQATLMTLLQRLMRPDVELDDVEAVLREDAALAYRMLRAVNAASYGLNRRISSIHDALVLLGTERLRGWIVLLATSSAGAGQEQLSVAITRARTCEVLAPGADVRPDVAFTAGLLSALDVVLDTSLEDLLRPLALDPTLEAALLRGAGPLGSLLGFVVARETGLPPSATERYLGHHAPHIDDATHRDAHLGAMVWSTGTRAAVG